MSLPTSGFDTQTIRYDVVTEGDISVSFTVEVRANSIGAGPAEDVAAVLDVALPSLAADLEGVTGVTNSHVYKTFEGVVPPVDIA